MVSHCRSIFLGAEVSIRHISSANISGQFGTAEMSWARSVLTLHSLYVAAAAVVMI